MPEVTILMVTRGLAVAAEATVRSLFAQTLDDFELLVLDVDGDDGAAWDGLVAEDPRASLVSMPGVGLGEALNHGVTLAQGGLIARVDEGDLSAPERLSRQAALLRVAVDLAFVGTGWREMRPDGSVRRMAKPPAGDAALRAAMMAGDVIGHPTAMMRRDAVIAAGAWRPAFLGLEDYDLLLRLLDRHFGACVPQVLVEFPASEEVLGWRALEQRILSEMGAVAARDRRQVGRPDHGEQQMPLDRELLYRMGMAEEEIGQGVIARALSAAIAAGDAGEWRSMREAARLGLRQDGLPKQVKSQFVGLWLRSVAHWRPPMAEASDPGIGGHTAA